MSFFSMPSRKKKYQNGHYGSNHYQKKKGIFGNLFRSSFSRSRSGREYQDYDDVGKQNSVNPHKNQPSTMDMTCSKCTSKIPAGSKFCLECGAKVNEASFCMNCGEKLPANAKFCLQCGSKVNG